LHDQLQRLDEHLAVGNAFWDEGLDGCGVH
jgi:hypothetical protein